MWCAEIIYDVLNLIWCIMAPCGAIWCADIPYGMLIYYMVCGYTIWCADFVMLYDVLTL